MVSPEDPNYITPPNYLKQKVGSGGLPPDLLQKAQEYIDDGDDDFAPYAKHFIEFIETLLMEIRQSSFRTHDQVTNLIYPVLQLKAHGGMFGQDLISKISASALHFLENIYILDDDALDVLKAHYQALFPISESNIKSLKETTGDKLVQELNDACARYYKKYDIKPEN